MKKAIISAAAVIICALSIGLGAYATSAETAVRVELSGIVMRNNANVPVDKLTLQPGEVITWELKSFNGEKAAIRDFKVQGHIPRGTEFVAGSAVASNANVLYSVDGKNFSAKPTIKQKDANGREKEVEAPVSAYTDVQFSYPSLNSNQATTALYQVKVK